MGQCYPSKICSHRCSMDEPELFSSASQPNLLSQPKAVHGRQHRHSHPPHTFNTLYRRSKIVNKQLFLNSGFMDTESCYTPALEQPSRVPEVTESAACNTSKAESGGFTQPRRVISGTFAYSVSVRSTPFAENSVVVPRLVYDLSDTSLDIPKLVYDVTADRTTTDPRTNSLTFITVLADHTNYQDNQFLASPHFDVDTPTDSSTPTTTHSPRTLAGNHSLPLVTKISLESLTSDTSDTQNMLRIGDCDMETIAYF